MQGDEFKGASSVGGNSGNGRRHWTTVDIRWYRRFISFRNVGL